MNITFTREELLSNAYCCGNGCLNCPYIPKHVEGETNVEKKPDTTHSS